MKIERQAIRIHQNKKHSLFMFSLTRDELKDIADISRVSRDDNGRLIGYQRGKAKQHIQEIVDYLDGDEVLFPNPIILAFSNKVKFTGSRGRNANDAYSAKGTIHIPIPKKGEKKPAWIVDGQQRATAIWASRNENFPVPVSAFIADNLDLQRDQFIRINNSKALPKGLIDELLPEVSSSLPSKLSKRKAPSMICNELNTNKSSPFYGLIKRTTTTKEDKKKAIIADNSIINMIQDSLSNASGCLFPYSSVTGGGMEIENILCLVLAYWNAVSQVFPEAWGVNSKRSRLMGGVGIHAMGKLMDRVMSNLHPSDNNLVKKVREELEIIAPYCHWTDGDWDFGLNWRELQNVPRHKSALSQFLVKVYVMNRNR